MTTFTYNGRIYVKTCGRGICLLEINGHQILEDLIKDGFYVASITLARDKLQEYKPEELTR